MSQSSLVTWIQAGTHHWSQNMEDVVRFKRKIKIMTMRNKKTWARQMAQSSASPSAMSADSATALLAFFFFFLAAFLDIEVLRRPWKATKIRSAFTLILQAKMLHNLFFDENNSFCPLPGSVSLQQPNSLIDQHWTCYILYPKNQGLETFWKKMQCTYVPITINCLL